jgi:uncharacterized membrane protein
MPNSFEIILLSIFIPFLTIGICCVCVHRQNNIIEQTQRRASEIVNERLGAWRAKDKSKTYII